MKTRLPALLTSSSPETSRSPGAQELGGRRWRRRASITQHRAGKGQEMELGAKGQGSRGAAQTRSLEDSLSHVTTGWPSAAHRTGDFDLCCVKPHFVCPKHNRSRPSYAEYVKLSPTTFTRGQEERGRRCAALAEEMRAALEPPRES